jgi:hypothetical protein
MAVTKDATTNVFMPASASEWTTQLTGTSISNPSAAWRFQDASGNFADAVGSFTLTATLSPNNWTYLQAITGWSTSGGDCPTDNKACNATSTSASLPALDQAGQANSFAMLGYFDLTNIPSGNRDIMEIGASGRVRITSTPRIAIVSGSNSTTGTKDPVNGTFLSGGSVIPVMIVVNKTAGTWRLYTSQEKLNVTPGTIAAGKVARFGGTSGANLSPTFILPYGAMWIGAAAEFTDEMVYQLLTGLGFAMAWTAADFTMAPSASTSFVGKSLASGVLSAFPDSTTSFVGAPLAKGVLSASADSTTSLVGKSPSIGVLSAPADSTTSLVAKTLASGVLSATGDSTTSLTAIGTYPGALSSSADSTTSLVGSALAIGELDATADSSADFDSVAGGSTFTASADSTASFIGAAKAAGVLAATANSTAAFDTFEASTGALTAIAIATSSLVGASLYSGLLSASGEAFAAFGGSRFIADADSTAIFVGRSFSAAIFSAIGSSNTSFNTSLIHSGELNGSASSNASFINSVGLLSGDANSTATFIAKTFAAAVLNAPADSIALIHAVGAAITSWTISATSSASFNSFLASIGVLDSAASATASFTGKSFAAARLDAGASSTASFNLSGTSVGAFSFSPTSDTTLGGRAIATGAFADSCDSSSSFAAQVLARASFTDVADSSASLLGRALASGSWTVLGTSTAFFLSPLFDEPPTTVTLATDHTNVYLLTTLHTSYVRQVIKVAESGAIAIDLLATEEITLEGAIKTLLEKQTVKVTKYVSQTVHRR